MKQFIFVVALFFATTAKAQITKASLQASGLTCSMCSNAINKSLKAIDFVEKVEPNIKNSSFDVFFKPGSKVDLDVLKTNVEDAGFFVASLTATIQFAHTTVANDSHITVAGSTFHFLNIKDQELDGEKTIKVLDKGYVTAKAFKQNSKYTSMACYQTGKAGACCAKAGTAEGTRIYHVTI